MTNSEKAHQRKRRRWIERGIFVAVIIVLLGTILLWQGGASSSKLETAVSSHTPERPIETVASTEVHTAVPSPIPTKIKIATDAATAASATVLPTSTVTHTPAPTAYPTPLPTDICFNSRVEVSLLPTPTLPPLLPTPYKTVSLTLQVPILMYHHISEPPADAGDVAIPLFVPPDQFRQQMAYLADNDFTPISLYDLSFAIAAKKELPNKPIIITLDDGYVDNYMNARPILLEFSFPATFFIPTDFLDRQDYNYMSWEMVMELSFVPNFYIEPHSVTHPDMKGLTVSENKYQMSASRDRILSYTGRFPRFFAYPSGRYDENSMQAAEELGFWGALTTNGGVWHSFTHRYEWTRLRMHPNLSMEDFAERVE